MNLLIKKMKIFGNFLYNINNKKVIYPRVIGNWQCKFKNTLLNVILIIAFAY